MVAARSAARGRHRGGFGFTLIELLIVIAIIVVLMALLLPALSAARANARMTTCAQQLNELGELFRKAHPNVGAALKANAVKFYFNRHLDDTETAWRCPSNHEYLDSYGFNVRLHRLHVKDDKKIIALDYVKGVAEVVGLPVVDDPWEDYVAPRHFDTANVLFYDGHVENLDPTVIDPRSCEIQKTHWIPTQDERLLTDCAGGFAPLPPPPDGGTSGDDETTDTTNSSDGSSDDGSSDGSSDDGSDESGECGSCPFTGSPDDLDCALIAHYSFDDALDLGLDSSGNENHGTAFGAWYADDPERGGTAEFNGASNYIKVPDTILCPTAGTVALWVWGPPAPPAQRNPAAATAFGTSADRPHNSRINFQVYGMARGAVEQNCGFSGAPEAAFVFTNHWDEGVFRGEYVGYQWFHLAMVWREDQSGEGYLNGVSVFDICTDVYWADFPDIPFQCIPRAPDRYDWPAPPQCPPPANAAEFQKEVRIGNFMRVQDGAQWNHWEGRIDDVRVYSRALTAGEINALQ